MLETLKANLPIILLGVAMVALFALGNFGVLTSEQVEAIMLAVGIGGGAKLHRMDPPVKADVSAKTSLTSLFIACVFLLAGCGGGSLHDAQYARQVSSGQIGAAPPPSPYCESVDSTRSTAGFLGKLFAGGATVAAGSVVYWKEEKSDNIAALTGAAMAAVSGAFLGWSEERSTTYVERCPQ